MENSTEEAKTLVDWIIDAGIAMAIFGVLALILTLASNYNDVLASRDESKQALQSYAKYVAFSDATVRGQDLLSLAAETQGEPFIIIFDKDNTNKCIAKIYNDESTCINVWDVDVRTIDSSSSVYLPAQTIASYIGVADKTLSDIPMQQGCYSMNWSGTNTYIEDIQSYLLARGGGTYKAYKTDLLYDKDSSYVIGIVAVEVN